MSMRYYTRVSGQDHVWLVMYTWARGQIFLSAQLDPQAPGRAAKQAWTDFSFPQGTLTWEVLDQLQLDIHGHRIQRKLTGDL